MSDAAADRAAARSDEEAAEAVDADPEDDDGDEGEMFDVDTRGRAGKEVLDWTLPDLAGYILQDNAKLTLDQLRFDELGVEGQARGMDFDVLAERREDLKKNPPMRPIQATVWQDSIGVLRVQWILCALFPAVHGQSCKHLCNAPVHTHVCDVVMPPVCCSIPRWALRTVDAPTHAAGSAARGGGPDHEGGEAGLDAVPGGHGDEALDTAARPRTHCRQRSTSSRGYTFHQAESGRRAHGAEGARCPLRRSGRAAEDGDTEDGAAEAQYSGVLSTFTSLPFAVLECVKCT